MTETKESVFETLSKIDVSNHVDVIKMKSGFNPKYVSWSWAWNYVKSHYPDTPTPKFEKFPEMVLKTHLQEYNTKYGKRYKKVVDSWEMTGRAVPYLTTTTGTMVTCTVHVDGKDYTESLYVMDNSNNAVIDPDQAQINKTQKRCLVKALAMAGLGLNLYAGEDLPMGDISEQDKKKQEALEKAKRAKEKADQEKNEKLNQQYRELIDKSVEATGKDVVTIEEGIKKLAKSKRPNFDSLSNAVRKSMLIEILQQTLKKRKTTEQQNLEEVS